MGTDTNIQSVTLPNSLHQHQSLSPVVMILVLINQAAASCDLCHKLRYAKKHKKQKQNTPPPTTTTPQKMGASPGNCFYFRESFLAKKSWSNHLETYI